MTNYEIGQRIEQCRKERGLTLGDIADELGVARSTIQRYEKGSIEKLKMPILQSIANVLRVNPSWLVGKSEEKEIDPFVPDNIISIPRTSIIPLIGQIACGTPILAEENVEDEIDLPEHIKADFALRCRGDSMVNARIHDGDIVYIRQQPMVNNGEIAAVLIGEEATLKRVYASPNTLILQAANPNYEPMVFAGEQLESVRVLGKAVGFTSADI